MRKILLPAIISSLLLFSGCCSKSSEKSQQPAQPAANKTEKLSDKEKLHNRAKLAEAATLVGYDGKQIRENLDKIIDANDAHKKMFEDLDGL